MAYLLSVSFSMPLSHLQPQFEGSCRKLTGGRLSNTLPSRTERKVRLPKYSGRAMAWLSGSHHCNIYPASRPVLYHCMCSSAHVQISGFWMGPEIEDGWGFIEATVLRIY